MQTSVPFPTEKSEKAQKEKHMKRFMYAYPSHAERSITRKTRQHGASEECPYMM